MSLTYADVLSHYGVSCPAHLEAQDQIPIAEMFVAQGDVYARKELKWSNVIADRKGQSCQHIKVVQGDADRNSHILHCPDGIWYPGPFEMDSRLSIFGLVMVPKGEAAYLSHTAEHGSVGLSEGIWCLWPQIEFAEQIRTVVD